MNDYPTTLRVIAAYKAGEDLAQRLESAIKAQNAMADALRNAADEIERLEELRQLDGESMGVLIAECQDMKDRLVNGDQIEPLHNGVAGYTDGISAGNEAKQSYEKSDEKRMNTNMSYTIDKKAYEGDIVSRLRNWRGLHLAHTGVLFDAAADEIERLRSGGACPHVRGTVTQHCSLNFTLTDAEREAVEWCLSLPMLDRDIVRMMPLRSLLERLK